MLLIHLSSSMNVIHFSWNVHCTFDKILSPFHERLREILADVGSQSLSFHERPLTYCIVWQKVHPTPLAYVSDRTTNDCDDTPNNRLTLNFIRTFVTYLRNVCQMTKSVDHYPLYSLLVNSPYPTPLSIISTVPILSYFLVKAKF
jgi:hypothetical protein